MAVLGYIWSYVLDIVHCCILLVGIEFYGLVRNVSSMSKALGNEACVKSMRTDGTAGLGN